VRVDNAGSLYLLSLSLSEYWVLATLFLTGPAFAFYKMSKSDFDDGAVSLLRPVVSCGDPIRAVSYDFCVIERYHIRMSIMLYSSFTYVQTP
jgi:hypothetical protein